MRKWMCVIAAAGSLWSWPAAAQIPTFQPLAGTLGDVPDGPTLICGSPGPPRDVLFDLTQMSGVVQAVDVTLAFAPAHTHLGEITVTLIDPGGRPHVIFGLTGSSSALSCGSSADLQGPYTFSDAAALNWWTTPGTPKPAGTYRTSSLGGALQGGRLTSMNLTFEGRPIAGVWTLRVTDSASTNTTAVSMAALAVTPRGLRTIAPDPLSLGVLPSDPVGSLCPGLGPYRDVIFDVPAGTGPVKRVAVSAGLQTQFVREVWAELISPAGALHVLFGHTGAVSVSEPGDRTPLGGVYTFADWAVRDWWDTARNSGITLPLPPGAYRTSAPAFTLFPGAVTSMDPVFLGTPSSGVWTLRLYDNCHNSRDVVVSSASLALWTVDVSTVDDAHATAFETPLTVPAPGVLSNDTASEGALTAALVAGPANGTVVLQPDGRFHYTPRAGFAGDDTFTYRASAAGVAGPPATVRVTVQQPTVVQAPARLETIAIDGLQVTLRWDAPVVGPSPEAYLLEGGTAPGQTLGQLAVPAAYPIVTLALPPGAFYLRVRAHGGAITSAPSNEMPLVVGVAAPPSAPVTLTALALGDALTLRWKNTLEGGAPTTMRLDVSGGATGVAPLPLGESFAVAGVPPGTYTLRVRAANAVGLSPASAPVTVTVPGGCVGAPGPPERLLAYRVGSRVGLVWDPPSLGAAPTGYVIAVGGDFDATVPTDVRTLSAPAPPGTYTFAVTAVNACGASAPTPSQTVTVP